MTEGLVTVTARDVNLCRQMSELVRSHSMLKWDQVLMTVFPGRVLCTKLTIPASTLHEAVHA